MSDGLSDGFGSRSRRSDPKVTDVTGQQVNRPIGVAAQVNPSHPSPPAETHFGSVTGDGCDLSYPAGVRAHGLRSQKPVTPVTTHHGGGSGAVELTLICGGCGAPAPDGHLSVRDAEIRGCLAAGTRFAWRAWHYGCDPDPDEPAYQIEAVTLRTPGALDRWTEHLASKRWFPFTDWDELLREAAGDIPARRIRAAGRAAA